MATFPPCFEARSESWPQKMCPKMCLSLWDSCGLGFENVERAGFGDHLIKCSDKIGNATKVAYTYLYQHYLQQWNGSYMYMDRSTALVSPAGNSIDVPCFDSEKITTRCSRKQCPLPYVEYSRSISTMDSFNSSTCSDKGIDGIDCDNCESTCQQQCPYPLWDEATWDRMWIARWLPAVLGIPLNLGISVIEGRKLRSKSIRTRAQANVWVFLCAFVGLLYALLDAVPTMVLKADIRCNGDPVLSEDNHGGHPFCKVGVYNVHLLQILLGCVGVTMFQLYQKLKYAAKFKSYTLSRRSTVLCSVYVLLPVVLILIHSTLPTLDGQPNTIVNGTTILTDMYDANNIRYQFSCGPRFEHLEYEWGLVMIPLIFYGSILIIYSALLLQMVFQMTVASSNGQRKAVNRTMMNLAKTMIRLSLVCAFLTFLNLGTVVPFLGKALEFSGDLYFFSRCAASGGDLTQCAGNVSACDIEMSLDNITAIEEKCGKYDEMAPNPALMVLINLSYSCPPFAFGLLFGYNLLKTAYRRISKTVATSIAPGSNTSSASSEITATK
uniref:FZ domain-containing protein n=1 Tax=Mucochytrium quahogii TaxID=96639 RepID=A0A7S2WUE8_9STRA|mmetsp:Transcript_18216/g.29614  ORF Transcript_18216/g.29614 Transcript_18216/m.29614 type:complete len:552 (+) Transcript_18216:220-1875(+)